MQNKELHDYISSHTEEAIALLIEFAQIPAPSGHEALRAEFCKTWLEAQGAEGVYIDDALNVIYPIGVCATNPLVVFMAHSDVVFPDTTPLPIQVSDNYIHCPGVGDDTANVIALLMAAKYIASQQLTPKEHGVLLVINSCEEGLGNLKGSRRIMETFGNRVTEFVTFDGYASGIVDRAVGSKRYEISVETEGGHSFAKFGNANAIVQLSEIIKSLYEVEVPADGKTTYNIGLISGGTSVNTIAQHAEMLYEFRSDSRNSLAFMEKTLETVLDIYRARGFHLNIKLIGERPCSADIDKDRQEDLSIRALDAVKANFGIDATRGSGSTDCNIPLSLGIPSVCVSCITGGGAHTREEYVDIPSIAPGIGVALDMVLYHF